MAKIVGPSAAGTVVTLGFIALWYVLIVLLQGLCMMIGDVQDVAHANTSSLMTHTHTASYPLAHTHTYRYGLNVAFNLSNKVIFGYFPYPWTVSTVHVLVGLIYCTVTYLVGAKAASFDRVRWGRCVCVCVSVCTDHVTLCIIVEHDNEPN